MEKSAEAFRTISEVATELDVPQHVLRFWETKFPQVKPLKRGGGRRYYRPQDIDLLRAIKQLLYAEGFTIRGVQRILKERGVRAVCSGSYEASPEGGAASETAEAADTEDVDPCDTADAPSPTSVETAIAEVAPDDDVDPAPSPTETSPVPAPLASLAAEDTEKLGQILTDLERCVEILAAARRD
jgi:DNA-binding transcriptional MerR regulator